MSATKESSAMVASIQRRVRRFHIRSRRTSQRIFPSLPLRRRPKRLGGRPPRAEIRFPPPDGEKYIPIVARGSLFITAESRRPCFHALEGVGQELPAGGPSAKDKPKGEKGESYWTERFAAIRYKMAIPKTESDIFATRIKRVAVAVTNQILPRLCASV